MKTGISPSTPLSTIRRNQRIREKRIQLLAGYWSRFNDEQAILPLSLGIREDLLSDAKERGLPITESQINMGLYAYTKRAVYLKSLIEACSRFDLNSNPVGAIDPEHRKSAIQGLSEIRKVFSIIQKDKKKTTIKPQKKAKELPRATPAVTYKRKRRTLTLPSGSSQG